MYIWSFRTVCDTVWVNYCLLIGSLPAYIQTGNWKPILLRLLYSMFQGCTWVFKVRLWGSMMWYGHFSNICTIWGCSLVFTWPAVVSSVSCLMYICSVANVQNCHTSKGGVYAVLNIIIIISDMTGDSYICKLLKWRHAMFASFTATIQTTEVQVTQMQEMFAI